MKSLSHTEVTALAAVSSPDSVIKRAIWSRNVIKASQAMPASYPRTRYLSILCGQWNDVRGKHWRRSNVAAKMLEYEEFPVQTLTCSIFHCRYSRANEELKC
jgi:hypothetical protein